MNPTPTRGDFAALQSFADAHGKHWKTVLTDTYWYNARLWRGPAGDDERTGSTLHAIRNNFGPDWLHNVCRVKPSKVTP
jgi:hypothetical protein